MNEPVLGKVVVTGGTGLIGSHLVEALIHHKAAVEVVTRRPTKARLPIGASACSWKELPAALESADAVYNLAGEGIAEKRWSAERKQIILRSRTESTRQIVEALRKCSKRPRVLVNASAIGYYGPGSFDPMDEEAGPGKDFLAKVCQAWEHEAEAVQALGVRLVKMRFGIVLAPDGGALPKLIIPVKHFFGCPLGSGSQGFSWIHIEDLVNLLVEAALNPDYEGAVNATAPKPVSQKEFMSLLARRLHRPLWHLPSAVTRLSSKCLLGERAEPMLLHGAYIYPKKALKLGFHFAYEKPDRALSDLV